METKTFIDHDWIFWSRDWSKKIKIYWGGKTPFRSIIYDMKKVLGNNLQYERAFVCYISDDVVKYE